MKLPIRLLAEGARRHEPLTTGSASPGFSGLLPPRLTTMARQYRIFHARLRAAAFAARLATACHPYSEYVAIQHLPASRIGSRWGHGRPPHPGLDALIASGAPAYRRAVDAIRARHSDLTSISRDGTGPGEPRWANAWIPPLDGACLYTFVRDLQPANYVEVGSGNSTLFVDRARRDGHLATTITSIDPEPRSDVDDACDRVIRAPLESIDLEIFHHLRSGDMVFVDNSHLALMGSDATVFLLEVLPLLRPGVLVGIHDIFLPCDYFPSWREYYFGEQYILAALLIGQWAGYGGAGYGGASISVGNPDDSPSRNVAAGTARWIEPFMATYYVSCHPELSAPLDDLWTEPCFSGLDPAGWSFWFRIGETPRGGSGPLPG